MKYSEIIKYNGELGNNIQGEKEYKIAILSNIMVHQSKEICEYTLRSESINASVLLGEYDNIIQDSIKITDVNAVIIFWEACNFIDGLQFKADNLNDNDFEEIIEKIKNEIDLIINNLINIPLVLINKFSSLVFNGNQLTNNKLDQIVSILNTYLHKQAKVNIKLIDLDSAISQLSINNSVDLRYYYSSKTLYSINFYKEYFEYIKPIFLAANGKIKKALIFDCDNTLWKGILGEDGFNNIKIFREIQYLALNLSKKGVIIGLCSKNNTEDVNLILEKHPDMILKNKNIVIKKINWADKVTNLKEISSELNIGLDSMVFLDDSDFEIGLITKELPKVSAFKVPNTEYEYGLMFRKISGLFYNPFETKEDACRINIYKDQLKRQKDKNSAVNIESYLKTLGLTINVYIDNIDQAPRISQMTQKTNQFNLTTKRYTENDIRKIIDSKDYAVISIGVRDKYGDNGITGLAILDISKLQIDTLLLSCRILGRNIEYRFMDILISFLTDKSIKNINSQYVKTNKNQQVSNYYENCGFNIVKNTQGSHQYSLTTNSYKNKNIEYIEIKKRPCK